MQSCRHFTPRTWQWAISSRGDRSSSTTTQPVTVPCLAPSPNLCHHLVPPPNHALPLVPPHVPPPSSPPQYMTPLLQSHHNSNTSNTNGWTTLDVTNYSAKGGPRPPQKVVCAEPSRCKFWLLGGVSTLDWDTFVKVPQSNWNRMDSESVFSENSEKLRFSPIALFKDAWIRVYSL